MVTPFPNPKRGPFFGEVADACELDAAKSGVRKREGEIRVTGAHVRQHIRPLGNDRHLGRRPIFGQTVCHCLLDAGGRFNVRRSRRAVGRYGPE